MRTNNSDLWQKQTNLQQSISEKSELYTDGSGTESNDSYDSNEESSEGNSYFTV